MAWVVRCAYAARSRTAAQCTVQCTAHRVRGQASGAKAARHTALMKRGEEEGGGGKAMKEEQAAAAAEL